MLNREKRTMKHLLLTEKRALFTQKKEGASVMASIYLSHHSAFFFSFAFCSLPTQFVFLDIVKGDKWRWISRTDSFKKHSITTGGMTKMEDRMLQC